VKLDVKSEKDIEQLRRIAVVQQGHIAHLSSALAAAHKQLAALTGKEATEALQATLAAIEAFEAEARKHADGAVAQPEQDAAPPTPNKERKAREQFGATPQPSLPRVEETFELDAADRVCTQCGAALAAFKGQFDESEMIDVVEISYRVVHVKRQKYVCTCGDCIESAPGPERVAPGSRYSLAFAVKVALDKYLDHIPLERQVRIMKRHGLKVTTQTLWDVLNLLGRRLERASQALLSAILSQQVIGLDQTSWKRLDGSKQTPWQMWALTAPRLVAHRIREDKSADTMVDLLKGFKGTIVCDALATHKAGLQPNQRLAGCWAHVFRKFEEAAPDHPNASVATEAIGKLYAIDAK
jgi:transposase